MLRTISRNASSLSSSPLVPYLQDAPHLRTSITPRDFKKRFIFQIKVGPACCSSGRPRCCPKECIPLDCTRHSTPTGRPNTRHSAPTQGTPPQHKALRPHTTETLCKSARRRRPPVSSSTRQVWVNLRELVSASLTQKRNLQIHEALQTARHSTSGPPLYNRPPHKPAAPHPPLHKRPVTPQAARHCKSGPLL